MINHGLRELFSVCLSGFAIAHSPRNVSWEYFSQLCKSKNNLACFSLTQTPERTSLVVCIVVFSSDLSPRTS